MEDKQRLLIALGAAAAVNCLPCSEHIMAAAHAAGITAEEMEQVWQVSQRVKQGADEMTQSWLRDQLAGGDGEVAACSCVKTPSNCPLPGGNQAGVSSGSCCA